jgi:hypothetical protein
MSVQVTTPASRARAGLLLQLEAAGVDASADVGAFYPQPVGVLVGLPALRGRLLAGWTFELPVLVVSADPLNSELNVDRVYALADQVALVLATAEYRPSSWRSTANAEPLPALELTVTVTVSEEGTP